MVLVPDLASEQRAGRLQANEVFVVSELKKLVNNLDSGTLVTAFAGEWVLLHLLQVVIAVYLTMSVFKKVLRKLFPAI